MTKIKGAFAKNYDRFIKRPTLLPDGLLALVKACGAKAILDFACGTGNIAVGLSLEGFDVTGVDHSADMLARAREKAKSNRANTKLILGDITKIDLGRDFDLILCTGNTIPLLRTERELIRFIANCKKHLRPGGRVLFQQLNYDRILRERPATFAVDVDGEIVRYKQYRYLENRIEFIVTIVYGQEIPPKMVVSRGKITPRLKTDLKSLLRGSGFSHLHAWGNYKKDQFGIKSNDLILTGRLKN